MDGGRFDNWAKAMVTPSRRGVARILAGGAVGGVLARLGGEAAGAGCLGRACRGGGCCAGTACGPNQTCCRPVGGRCKKGAECCSRRCSRRGRCRPCSSEQNTCLVTERFNAAACTCDPCPRQLCNGACCPADKPSCCGDADPPRCRASQEGGTCESDEDCCFTVCQEGQCCLPSGSPCSQFAHCCGGRCTDGVCP